MNFNEYKNWMKNKLSKTFDIKEDYKYKKVKFDLFGTFKMRNEKYMASKKFVIYAFENDEYCFLKYYRKLDEDILNNLITVLKSSILDYVKPHHEHMSSIITGVIVVDNLKDEKLIKRIKKFSYQKSFMFGLKGWVDVVLVLVLLNEKKVITSKRVKKVGAFYQP
ncbi:hypothetical protein [Caminicella sporogenes]|uniref:hypothetical protein n=1 Tax=Caminicella sporogenes TaxID=166485 RepID=UPI002541590E|nr:hypothetical protein [Caminicella sporogenes]WIF95480.1 hypothetical protein QNI18_02230 [Caminicella sporogenes]